MLSLPLKVPNDSTLSRRQHTLIVKLPRASSRTPRHRVVDSTDLKVYGEGEWKVRQHGVDKCRTWRRKLYLAVDANTQEIVAVELTANAVGDAKVLPDLLEQLASEEALATVAADRAYDAVRGTQLSERGMPRPLTSPAVWGRGLA
jgi:hypothetical protein